MIVALAAMLPEWMGWLAVFLINRECDRIEREMRALGDVIQKFARAAMQEPLRRGDDVGMLAALAAQSNAYSNQFGPQMYGQSALLTDGLNSYASGLLNQLLSAKY